MGLKLPNGSVSELCNSFISGKSKHSASDIASMEEIQRFYDTKTEYSTVLKREMRKYDDRGWRITPKRLEKLKARSKWLTLKEMFREILIGGSDPKRQTMNDLIAERDKLMAKAPRSLEVMIAKVFKDREYDICKPERDKEDRLKKKRKREEQQIALKKTKQE